MFRKVFLFHIIFFFLLGTLLFLSSSLTFRSTIVHICYALLFFSFFLAAWTLLVISKQRIFQYILIYFYYNYLFLLYVLFKIGKENLGVPMTLKMIYPYFENFSLLTKLISYQNLIILLIAYILILGVIFYVWNKIYKSVSNDPLMNIKLIRYKRVLIALSIITIIFLIFKKTYFINKFNDHKINEPYLTLIYFDEAFKRQKEKGIENSIEFDNYFSSEGNKKNVILIICDALRPDFFQSQEKLTPFVDSLISSESFISHKNMYSNSAFSFNGISNILSSSIQLYENNFFIHDLLKKKGYDVNFILSGDMTNFWDLKGHIKTKSVDFYSDGYENFKFGRSDNLNDDKKNILSLLDKINSFNETPTFFYFHMMSVHQISVTDKKYKRFDTGNINLGSSKYDSESLTNDYKNRMIQLDDYVRKLYNILKRKGYLEDYVFVITSDHGQSLGENQVYFHSKDVNYESIKIPLIINTDDLFDSNAVTSQLDIAPTILKALDLKIPKTWRGSIISDTIPKTIFQNQGDKYSMIWKNNKITYQLYFNKVLNKFNLFDISLESANRHNDISSLLTTYKLDSLKNILAKNFKLKL